MALVATKILEGDPRFDAEQEKYEISGSFANGPVIGVPLPQVCTFEQASTVLSHVQKNKSDEMTRLSKPVDAMLEVVAVLQAAGATQ